MGAQQLRQIQGHSYRPKEILDDSRTLGDQSNKVSRYHLIKELTKG
jgi:hypothetical protein